VKFKSDIDKVLDKLYGCLDNVSWEAARQQVDTVIQTLEWVLSDGPGYVEEVIDDYS